MKLNKNNIYNSAIAPEDKKQCFNSEPTRIFCETARNIPDAAEHQRDAIESLIQTTKENLQ